MEKETVIYKGFKFNRYPEAKRVPDRRYYNGHVKIDGKWYKKRLHVFIWEWNNGKVTPGYHVHHIDGNFNNNELNNLACIKGSEHMSEHNKNVSPELNALRIKVLRDSDLKAREWHKSEAGHEWHKQQFAKSIGSDEITKCKECGNEFQKVTKRSMFCSRRCKNRYIARDARRRYTTKKIAICEVCSKEFKPIPNNAGRFCSNECYQRSRKSL